MFSAVIPAHNEASGIAKCLGPISEVSQALGGEVVVVCNGCTDETAAVARRFPGVTVVETRIPSKSHALNLGDKHCTLFPRLYVDADLEITPEDLRSLIVHLSQPGALLLAPKMRLNYSSVSRASRWYHQFWSALPAYQARMGGLYGLSAAGRSRFDQFPDLTGDDAFVRSRFVRSEVAIPSDVSILCDPPRTLTDLVKVRTRIVRGGRELSQAVGACPDVPTNGLSDIRALMFRSPQCFAKGLCFLLVTLVVSARVRWQALRGAAIGWERDNSSREPG